VQSLEDPPKSPHSHLRLKKGDFKSSTFSPLLMGWGFSIITLRKGDFKSSTFSPLLMGWGFSIITLKRGTLNPQDFPPLKRGARGDLKGDEGN
jgi:hypothetical protein